MCYVIEKNYSYISVHYKMFYETCAFCIRVIFGGQTFFVMQFEFAYTENVKSVIKNPNSQVTIEDRTKL